MPEFTDTLLPRIEDHRLEGLNLADGFIYPHYEGLSILNLPASICRWLGASELGHPPLMPEVLNAVAELGGPFRRLILLVVDALGFDLFLKWTSQRPDLAWKDLGKQGVLAPLTSVVPSTTSSALPTLWTGRSPAEHGIVGYELWLKEYGIVANMIRHSPMSFESSALSAGSLEQAGFRPEEFLTYPTLGTHLSEHGIKCYAFQHASIARSGLSRMFFSGVDVQVYLANSDLWINLRRLFENRPQESLFAWVYLSDIDHLSHLYGPEDERTQAEFANFSLAFKTLFLDKLSPQASKETLLLLTADHGQMGTPPNPHYDLVSHPNLSRRLHIYPTGEHRLSYFYVHPGQREAVREYIERTWPGQFQLLDPGYAVEAGLFGPGQPHPRLSERLGDLIAAGRGPAYLWWSSKENLLLGRHGGLSREDMLVPLLAVRLDA
jgi:predicted AlkP superfamily pyrophosphatase or phosphodiesterase